LYFLAWLLHGLIILSKILQYKFVDVTSIGIQIESICMLYIIDSTNLNQDTFLNENYRYHVMPNYDSQGRKLQGLLRKIIGAKFNGTAMIKDGTSVDLESALPF